jgi:trehalose synthase
MSLLLPPDAHHDINALQRAADVIVQKSTREGFGLTVTEAMWKGKPVIGGAVGGIALQLRDYHTGFLVSSPEGCAFRIRYLLHRPEMARAWADSQGVCPDALSYHPPYPGLSHPDDPAGQPRQPFHRALT